MSLKDWIKVMIKIRWEIMVILSILFFIILLIFREPIFKYLRSKEDYNFFDTPLWKKPPTALFKKNESQCRRIFESIFKQPFPSCRPSFLKRSNGYALELDGYNKNLNLAFEYQGVQHYKYSNRFHRSLKDFEDQIQRDKDKRELCLKANVTVIEIPYSVPYQKLEVYIRQQLKILGYI